jgi:hypothetical protein
MTTTSWKRDVKPTTQLVAAAASVVTFHLRLNSPTLRLGNCNVTNGRLQFHNSYYSRKRLIKTAYGVYLVQRTAPLEARSLDILPVGVYFREDQ